MERFFFILSKPNHSPAPEVAQQCNAHQARPHLALPSASWDDTKVLGSKMPSLPPSSFYTKVDYTFAMDLCVFFSPIN